MKNTPPSEQGFALIEVMVSLLIFSLGIIGIIGMQARALQVGTESQDRNTAAILVNNLTSQMWASKTTSLSAAAVTAWKTQVQASLPNGAATVTPNSTGTDATISLTWKAPWRASTDSSSGFATKVVIPQ